MAVGRQSRSRGAAAVEFALVMPLLIVLVFGIIEFGRGYNAKVTLTHAAREAVREYAINGNAADAQLVGVNAASNLTGVTVTITDPCTGAAGETAKVDATWTFNYNIPLFKTSSIVFTETGAMRCGG